MNSFNYFPLFFELAKTSQYVGSLGLFQRVRFRLGEKIIVNEILKKVDNLLWKINYENFIENDKRKEELEKLYEISTSKILQFWKVLTTNNVKLPEFISDGREISRLILRI